MAGGPCAGRIGDRHRYALCHGLRYLHRHRSPVPEWRRRTPLLSGSALFRRPEVVAVGGTATIQSSVACAAVTGDNTIVLYGLLVGTVISMLVPVLIGFFIGI